MIPELDLLEQLLGDDIPLSRGVNLFPSLAAAQKAILAQVCEGNLEVLDADYSPVPRWKWDSWCRSESEWMIVAPTVILRVTDKGAKLVA